MKPMVEDMCLAIGDTPVVCVSKLAGHGHAEVYVKWEGANPTGSYKDRMALAMIEEAEKRGDLVPDMTVVEYTSGSTGSSLAMVCAVKGYRLRLVSSDAFSEEKLATMRAFGAELTVVPSNGGGITHELVQRVVATASEIASEPGSYFTDQFNNRDALVGYRRLGEELLDQLPHRPDVFCAAVGTAGMAMGVADAIGVAGAPTRLVVLEPAESPVLTEGAPGAHHVEGIGVGFRPPLLDDGKVDEYRAISEERGREMTKAMSARLGIFCGWSSGLNVAAALDIAAELGPGTSVATVACDTGLKYLAGPVFR